MDVNDKYPFGRAAYSRDNLQRSLVAPLDLYPAAPSGPSKRFGPQAKARNPRGGRPMAETINNFSDNGRGPNSRGATNPNSTVDLGTVKNDYAQGGDGTVAREAAPAQRSVNIAGGLSRDDIIRRMEMASTGMRGSPSARAAMMGAYADQLKSLDQGELDKNKGNIESDQLAYRGNMDANMQESRGRQEFGNSMGLLNRKGEMDAEAAAAAAEAQANDPYRKAQIENLTSQTEINRVKTMMEKGKYDAGIQAEQDAGVMALAKELYAGGKGKYATMDEALKAAALSMLAGGTSPRANNQLREIDNAMLDKTMGALGKGSFLGEVMAKGWSGAGVGNEGLKTYGEDGKLKQYSLEDFEMVPEDSWVNSTRSFFGAEPIQVIRPKGVDPNGYGVPIKRLGFGPGSQEDAELRRYFELRQRASTQQGQ